MAREDVEGAVAGLPAEQWWLQPGGIASVGFQVAHLAGSTDRLLTYARGEALSESQRAALGRERTIATLRPSPALQLALRIELAERRDQAVALHRRLIENLTPLLDDATLFLVTGYRNLDDAAPVPQELRTLAYIRPGTPKGISAPSLGVEHTTMQCPPR